MGFALCPTALLKFVFDMKYLFELHAPLVACKVFEGVVSAYKHRPSDHNLLFKVQGIKVNL